MGDDPAGDMKENSHFLQVLVSPTPGKKEESLQNGVELARTVVAFHFPIKSVTSIAQGPQ